MVVNLCHCKSPYNLSNSVGSADKSNSHIRLQDVFFCLKLGSQLYIPPDVKVVFKLFQYILNI